MVIIVMKVMEKKESERKRMRIVLVIQMGLLLRARIVFISYKVRMDTHHSCTLIHNVNLLLHGNFEWKYCKVHES